MIALLDIGADINFLQEGLIPTKYYEKNHIKITRSERILIKNKL